MAQQDGQVHKVLGSEALGILLGRWRDGTFSGIADLLLLASPIYSWYCTAPLKAALDRMVYAMNKYYGDQGRGPSLWRGRAVAAVTTCGYRPERGADLWEEGLQRYCKHSQLRWLGMLSARHLGYSAPFMDGEKAAQARAFAAELLAAMEANPA